MFTEYKIILGSGSARRRQLLTNLDIDFEVRLIEGLEEKYPDNLKGEKIPLFLATQKSAAYSLADDELLITADTIVWQNGKVMGKPKSDADAKAMLHSLSGTRHEVITGVCVRTTRRTETFTAITAVSFAALTNEEIDYYVSKYPPMDKAGSYGIQEWIGYIGVEKIEGSYYNVMGLPVQHLYSILKTF